MSQECYLRGTLGRNSRELRQLVSQACSPHLQTLALAYHLQCGKCLNVVSCQESHSSGGPRTRAQEGSLLWH